MNLVAIGSQLFGFAVLMLFDFLKSFQNAPVCTITCKDFDKISGKTRFKRVYLKIVLIGEKGKSRFDNDVIIVYSCSHNEFKCDAPL